MEVANVKEEGKAAVINKTARVLKAGGVIVVPTDTVYGLAADASNEKAVEKVFEIKGRSKDKKLPVFVSSFEMLEEIADVQNEKVLNFLKRVWPGKITCVFNSKNGGTIGVRMPNHELVLKIIETLRLRSGQEFGGPITGTSANVSGGKEHTKINELIKEFGKPIGNTFLTIVRNVLSENKNQNKNHPDLILDAGDLPSSKPSTVLDCTVWPPKILREGAVSACELKKRMSGDMLNK